MPRTTTGRRRARAAADGEACGQRDGGGPGTCVQPGDLTRTLTTEARDPSWVDAAPFRAHLRHLMAVGALDAVEVAVVLGVSTPAVRHLLEGRAGRPPRRISPHTARRLLLVRAADVRALPWSLTPTDSARAALHRLRAGGWADAEVAQAVGATIAEVRRLETGSRCSRLLAVRLRGLARRETGVLDDQDLVPLRSAA